MINSLQISLEKCNYWKSTSINLGLEREQYLSQLLDSCNNNLIKVLVGQRRSGKSYILKQFIKTLIEKNSINPYNILYINFENQDFSEITNQKELAQLVKLYLSKNEINKDEAIYLIFDEIQEINGWEKLLSSYLADHNFKKEIFITGSNSKLLSSELATYITGRYLTIDVSPFSYQEFLKYNNDKASKESFLKYLLDSQLPEIMVLKDENIKANYIRNIKDSILFRDIVQRYKVQNVALLDKLFLFLVDNIANPFSVNSIVKKLEAEGYESNSHTVGNYIQYMEDAFIFRSISRYDIKGKRILEGEKKYYLNDLGFKKYLFSDYDPGIGKVLENYVFNQLRQSHYQLYIGKVATQEVDFIAINGAEKKYLQVAYLLADDKVIKREYGNLEKIEDNWEKLVISLDDVELKPRNGIKHIRAWEL